MPSQVALPAGSIELIERLTAVSRPILNGYYRKKLAIDDKSDDSPVTRADRETEAALRKAIESAFPDHGIVGEEYGPTRESADFVWVLDPLDGTRAFITGRPLFGTLVALTHQGHPILGSIDMPVLGDLWLGAVGRPTTLNGEPVRARDCRSLDAAYLSTVSPAIFDKDGGDRFKSLSAKVKSVSYGGDCYQYAMVATGFLDIVIERGLGIFDYLSLVPVLEGAGAAIRDWEGKPLTTQSTGEVIAAASPALLDKAMAAFQA